MITGLSYDALSTVFIFLIGVPALVLQSLQPELRRVVFKRWWWLLFEAGVPLLLSAAIVCAAIITQGVLPEKNPDGGLARGDWIWGGMFAALFSIAATTILLVLYNWRPHKIIERLEEELAHKSRRAASLNEDSLEDLIEVGRQSEKGQDKELVLHALDRLAEKMCGYRNYRGDRLETLIVRLPDILVTGSQPGSLQNFHTAAEILRRVVMTTSEGKAEPLRSSDRMNAVRALSTLGQAALTCVDQQMETEYTLLSYVQALGSTEARHPDMVTEVSQALYEVGAAAIGKKHTLIALAALEELLNITQKHCPARGELVADCLGLAAHFWAEGGTAREHITARLQSAENFLAQPLDQSLELAKAHCVTTSQFVTADKLHAMILDLKQSPLQ